MPQKKIWTVEELRSLILVYIKVKFSKYLKLQACLNKQISGDEQGDKLDFSINDKFVEYISNIIARRLIRNRYTTPLLSPRDSNGFFRLIIHLFSEIEAHKFEPYELKMLKKTVEFEFEVASDVVHIIVRPNRSSYKEYWRFIEIVLELATERNIPPTTLLTLEDATDQITRRMFTRKQFIAAEKRVVNKFTDINVVRKLLVLPLADIMVEMGREHHELERDIEKELIPLLRKSSKESRATFNTWLNGEVERIYTTA